MFKETLISACSGLNISLDQTKIAKLQEFHETFKVYKEKINLTAHAIEDRIAVEMFADSLVPLSFLRVNTEKSQTCLDVGSGPGFPGLVLKIARPLWPFSLLESNHKKCAFLEEVVNRLHLAGISVICERAERAGQNVNLREQFDLVFCRAVSSFSVALELLLPFVKTGGTAAFYRGHSAQIEAQETLKIQGLLGGVLAGCCPYRLPEVDKLRYIVLVSKVSPTPSMYPRRPGIPAKRPLTP